MMRWLAVSLLCFACGGREVSKVKYTHTSCETADCRIAPPSGPNEASNYVPPDLERGVPETPPPSETAPEPTCNLVAETLVSLELGNYAEPEERAPRIAAEERRCNAMKLSKDDRQCVVDSYDKASIAYCVPALFPAEPQPQALSTEQCNQIGKQMMANLESQLRAQNVPDQRLWERQLLTAMDACRADRWNAAMGQCAVYYIPMYPQNCAYIQPTGMVKRLEARLAKVKAP